MELFGTLIGITLATQVMIAITAGLLFPAFWLWMVIDSVMREEADYPGHSSSEKVLWVIALVLLQPASIVYFFVVYRAAAKRAQCAPAATVVAA